MRVRSTPGARPADERSCAPEVRSAGRRSAQPAARDERNKKAAAGAAELRRQRPRGRDRARETEPRREGQTRSTTHNDSSAGPGGAERSA